MWSKLENSYIRKDLIDATEPFFQTCKDQDKVF